MFLVGLTGGIASGKSTASKMFQKLDCPLIDADVISRTVVEPGKPTYNEIKKKFGHSIFHKNGQLNREKLGQMIFSNPEKRKQLNAIVHPAVKKQMFWEILTCLLKGYQFAILDVPLLFETKQMLPLVSYTIVVHCKEDQQLSRLRERNNLSEGDAQARIRSQMPMSEKCKLATYLIDNSKSRKHLEEQVQDIHKQLQSSKKTHPTPIKPFGFCGRDLYDTDEIYWVIQKNIDYMYSDNM